MQPGKEMPRQPHQNTQRGPSRELGPNTMMPIHYRHIPPYIAPLLIIGSLNHARRQIRIAHETLVLAIERQPMPSRHVQRQARRLDEDRRD